MCIRDRCILPPLAFEQASSEACAAHKRIDGDTALDLTCGLGVDALFLSRRFRRVVTLERNAMLARVASENFSRLGATNIEVVNTSAEDVYKRQLQLRVVNRHAVDDVKRQVRTRKLGITADQHARRSRRAGRRRRNIDSGDLSDHRLHDVRLASGRQVLLAHRRHGVTQ